MSFNFFFPKISALQANPKSETLYRLFLIRVFAGFTSLCIYPFPTRTENPFIISLKACKHSASVYFRDARSFRRSISQSYRIMYVYFLPIFASSIFTVCSELTSIVICISPFKDSISILSLLIYSIFICLMA